MTKQSHSQAYTLRKPKLKKTHIPSMFIEALFKLARTQKQPRCPSTDEWIRKLWYVYTMDYYLAIKMNAFESVLMRWMNLEPIIQSKVSRKRKTNIIYDHTYIESRKILLMDLLSSQQRRHIHFGHSKGRRKWNDMREEH